MHRTPAHPRPCRRLAGAALALALATATASASDRQDPYDVQAAMLVNLVKFVTWPGGGRPGGDLRICAVAAPRFAAALANLVRRGVPLEVVEVRSPAAVTRCQVAFLGRAVDDDLDDAAERLAAAGVLTVAGSSGAARHGVHVNFVLEGDRVRFEVNLGAVRRGGFEISSKVLRLARVVEGGSP
jgi:hypothetical protein